MSFSLRSKLASRSGRLLGSVIDSSTALIASQKHDVVRFAVGAPSEDLIDTANFDRCFGSASPGKYAYEASEGEGGLVDEIVRLLAKHGEKTSPDRIIVTSGGMQGLDVVFKLLVDPGDLVVVESPTYTNGVVTALSYGADILEAPVDADGLIVEALPELVAKAGRPPKLIYAIPNFQNPTGVSLSLERRRLLLQYAEQWGSVIIDDDPYGLLRFEGEAIPSLKALSGDSERVVSVRTFSKILAPGLRLGWIESSPLIREQIINAKQAIDSCSSVPTQHMVRSYLAKDLLEPHLERTSALYRERKYAMQARIEEQFGENAVYSNPQGGFFLWLTFENELADIDARRLFPIALAEGVAYIAGSDLSLSHAYDNQLRLTFATSSPERISTGIERIACAIESYRRIV